MGNPMKKRFLVSIILLVMIVIMLFTQNFWTSWLLGAFGLFFSLIAILIGILIFMENRQPSKTITWLIVLAVNPVLGFIFYIMFGQSYRKKKMFAEKMAQDEKAYFNASEFRPESSLHKSSMGDHQQLMYRLAQKLGKSPISFYTDTQILTNGTETFEKIKQELRNAKHHIHLEYYIVRDDELGREFKQILIDKVSQGVEIRFLYDAVGCWNLPDAYWQELREAGVQTKSFLPVRIPLFSNKVNFRNHRKIVVVDGKVGFIGGLNIGDEYLGKDEYFGFWRDTHLWLHGEAVRSLQLIFLQDWYYMTDEKLSDHDHELIYLKAPQVEKQGLGGVQMVGGGPDHEWEVIKNLFFSMIVSAKRSIWIASPYFIPDEDILSALKIACLSGIDVRLMVPSIPDKRIVFYASRSYFPELLEAGMKIYNYKTGFMHSKVVIVDEELASIGSSNMDMRSFHLNFEINCFLYGSESIKKLVADYEADMAVSEEITMESFKGRALPQKIVESLSRLASPLL